MKNLFKQNKGFTLIELIIVVAIIALLAGATFVAINPARRIGEANDAQRWADVTSIASAWALYTADNSGTAPSSTASTGIYHVTSGYPTHSECGDGTATTTASLDLSGLVTDGYLGSVPVDPSGTYTSGQTGYYMSIASSGVITVGSCSRYTNSRIFVVR